MKTFDARDVFRALGAGEIDSQLAAGWAHYKPITSAPTAIPTKAIVTTIQKGLRSTGSVVKVSGELDPLTAQALEDLSGPDWKHKTWLTHASNIIARRRGGGRTTPLPPVNGLGDDGLGSFPFEPKTLGFLLAGGLLYFALQHRK